MEENKMGVMEIIITCPKCGAKLSFHNVPASFHVVIGPEMTESTFEIIKAATMNIVRKHKAFSMPRNYDKDDDPEKAARAVDAYFNRLFFEVSLSKNHNELKNLRKKLEKAKLGVSKKLSKSFEHNKKSLLKLLDQKLKEKKRK
jgi:hypothetical protein